MKRSVVLVALLAFPLAGCFADQKQQVASCELEAMHLYPGKQSVDDLLNIHDYIRTCMQAHGYEFSPSQSACESSATMVDDPSCYAPMSWVGQLLYRLETGSKLREGDNHR
jgi:hypothetical protein